MESFRVLSTWKMTIYTSDSGVERVHIYYRKHEIVQNISLHKSMHMQQNVCVKRFKMSIKFV